MSSAGALALPVGSMQTAPDAPVTWTWIGGAAVGVLLPAGPERASGQALLDPAGLAAEVTDAMRGQLPCHAWQRQPRIWRGCLDLLDRTSYWRQAGFLPLANLGGGLAVSAGLAARVDPLQRVDHAEPRVVVNH